MNTGTVISLIISAVMLVIGVATFLINRQKDVATTYNEEHQKDDAIKESLIKANLKLDQVCSTTNETRTDIKAMDRTITNLDKRLTVVENEVDEIKKKVD